MKEIIRKPSAWIPIAMSMAAIVLLFSYLALFGNVQNEDEGTAAHLFQFLMGGQLPIILFFTIKWLPQKPKQTLIVLALQFFAAALAFAPIYILEM